MAPTTTHAIKPRNSSWVSINLGWSTISTVWLKKVVLW